MSPYYNGSLTTETREVAVSETWDTQSDWDAAAETQNVEVIDGSVQLIEVSPPASGVAQYRFEQDVTDGWYGNDATTVNAISYSSSSPYEGDYYASFDGSSSYAVLPFSPGSEWSVSVVFNTSQTQNNFGSAFVGCLTNETSGSWVGMSDGSQASEGVMKFQTGGGGDALDLFSSGTYDDGNWHLTTFGYDDSDGPVIYVDGGEDGAGSWSQYSASENWRLGKRGSVDAGYYAGGLDDSRFHDKRLSLTEHQNLYNTGRIDG